MAKTRWAVGVIALVLFLGLQGVQAQQIGFGRVTQTAETIGEAEPFSLGNLQPGDEVEVHIRRISGDLIPYAAIYNQTIERYAIRLEANADDPSRLDATYIIEEEAGTGDFMLRVTSDLEQETTGDFVVTYEARRGNRVLDAQEEIIERSILEAGPLILVNRETTYMGEIDAGNWQVNYLVYLDPATPVTISVTRTDGNLRPFLGVSPANQESYFIRATAETDAVSAVFPPEGSSYTSGYYMIAVTRFDFDAGASSGRFALTIEPLDTNAEG